VTGDRYVVDGQPKVQHVTTDCRALRNWRTDSYHLATEVERVTLPVCQVCGYATSKAPAPTCPTCHLVHAGECG